MIFADWQIGSAFIVAGVILLAMIGYAFMRLRAAEKRLSGVEIRGRR